MNKPLDPAKLQILTEDAISLREAAQELPRPVSSSTIYRWALRGVRGRKLETVHIGAQIITSRQAMTRFLAAIND